VLRSIFVLWLCAMAPVAMSQGQPAWEEGTHYARILPPQPTGLPPGKIQVVEIFSYACPGCNRFYPVIDRLAASLPSNAVMQYLPASFRADEDWPVFQRAYFAAQAMGISQRMHDAMFDAIWKSGELAVWDEKTNRARRPPPALPDIARFYAKAAGIDPQAFIATANSFGVQTKMSQADQFMAACGVAETPSIVVNGKYRLNPVTAGGDEETIQLVKEAGQTGVH
jgi:protein dithiol oxidoreductase (disulfide-forming)